MRKPSQRQAAARLSKARLAELIAEATVDCHDESEAATGFLTMIEEQLAMPFTTNVLGVEVQVDRVDMLDDGSVVAVCRRGKSSQRIPIVDLPLPSPPPTGSEWIAAYRAWSQGSW